MEGAKIRPRRALSPPVSPGGVALCFAVAVALVSPAAVIVVVAGSGSGSGRAATDAPFVRGIRFSTRRLWSTTSSSSAAAAAPHGVGGSPFVGGNNGGSVFVVPRGGATTGGDCDEIRAGKSTEVVRGGEESAGSSAAARGAMRESSGAAGTVVDDPANRRPSVDDVESDVDDDDEEDDEGGPSAAETRDVVAHLWDDDDDGKREERLPAAEFEAGVRAGVPAEAGRGAGVADDVDHDADGDPWRDEIRRARAFYAARITSAPPAVACEEEYEGEWLGESAAFVDRMDLADAYDAFGVETGGETDHHHQQHQQQQQQHQALAAGAGVATAAHSDADIDRRDISVVPLAEDEEIRKDEDDDDDGDEYDERILLPLPDEKDELADEDDDDDEITIAAKIAIHGSSGDATDDGAAMTNELVEAGLRKLRNRRKEQPSIPYIVTRAMRRVLTEELGYSQTEVRVMRPDVAVVLVAGRLRRPPGTVELPPRFVKAGGSGGNVDIDGREASTMMSRRRRFLSLPLFRSKFWTALFSAGGEGGKGRVPAVALVSSAAIGIATALVFGLSRTTIASDGIGGGVGIDATVASGAAAHKSISSRGEGHGGTAEGGSSAFTGGSTRGNDGMGSSTAGDDSNDGFVGLAIRGSSAASEAKGGDDDDDDDGRGNNDGAIVYAPSPTSSATETESVSAEPAKGSSPAHHDDLDQNWLDKVLSYFDSEKQ